MLCVAMTTSELQEAWKTGKKMRHHSLSVLPSSNIAGGTEVNTCKGRASQTTSWALESANATQHQAPPLSLPFRLPHEVLLGLPGM